jgi:hypothetical protein
VFQGKISLPSLKKEEGTIELSISKLLQLNRNLSVAEQLWAYGNYQSKTGEWSFKIPVTKQPSIEYALSGQTNIEGIPVRFDKLIIAPTTTTLQYGINTIDPEKRLEFLQFEDLEVNNKIVKVDQYGGYPMHVQEDMNWSTSQTQFDTLLGEKPKQVSVQLGSAYLFFQDNKMVELNVSQEYPQTFQYAGSTISIDKVDIGVPTTVVISDYNVENRAYEGLHVNVVGEDENFPLSMGMETEGVLVDKHGVKYDMNTPIAYEEIEQPRHYTTVQTIRLDDSTIIPKKLQIFGYNTTKYLNDIVKLSME